MITINRYCNVQLTPISHHPMSGESCWLTRPRTLLNSILDCATLMRGGVSSDAGRNDEYDHESAHETALETDLQVPSASRPSGFCAGRVGLYRIRGRTLRARQGSRQSGGTIRRIQRREPRHDQRERKRGQSSGANHLTKEWKGHDERSRVEEEADP